MTADPTLTLAWLVAAHLAADFLLQSGWMVRSKNATGGRALPGLLVHAAIVGVCLIPLGFAFGAPGWTVVAVVTVSHGFIDRVKVILTRRAEAAAIADARRRHESLGADPDGLGPAWTPAPAALFVLDQAVHVAILVAAWVALLARAPVDPRFAAAVDGWLGGWEPAAAHATILRAVVLGSLVVVNMRAAALFVGVLVGSRLGGHPIPPAPDAPPAAEAPAAWTVRLGPLAGRVEPDRVVSVASPAPAQRRAPPTRVGEAVGIIERLLVVTFVLSHAEAAIGLVIAAKTLARFKQLDDRDFAEYYLLGTLGSVAVAVLSSYVALAVLGASAWPTPK